MKFHPAAQIITWFLLTAMMQGMSLGVLLVAAGCMLLCTFILSRKKFIELLRRTRWIMLSLLLVYAYSTPGQPMLEGLGMFSPTREGLTDGMLQLARLLAALAGLAILLGQLNRQQLVAGLYTLMVPLQWVGMSRERVAVRLALTLQYAETAMLRETKNWQDDLRSLFEAHKEVCNPIELTLYRFSIKDGLLVGITLMLLLLMLR